MDAKATWRDLAAKFWVDSAQNKVKPLHRTKVFEWLCATDNMLRIATGEGWQSFEYADGPLPPPEAWRSVVCAVDQGGDGWSALHFLISRKLNVLPIGDPSHRVWNDVQLAINDVGLRRPIVTMWGCATEG